MSKMMWILLCAILLSAVQVIYVRHHSRLLFAQLQQLTAARDALNVEWGRLLLEEGAWTQHQRIEAAARQRLGMVMPQPEQIVIFDMINGRP